jgi:hypothetical protein
MDVCALIKYILPKTPFHLVQAAVLLLLVQVVL